MGATDFLHYGTGRTVKEAFKTAHDEAAYDFGHAGYTGTIAEKYGFVEFVLPPRVTAHKVYEAAWVALDTIYDSNSSQRRKTNTHMKARAQLVTWLGETQTTNLLRAIDDKWGPAAAIKLTKKEAEQFVPRTPTGKRKKNYEVWMFFGLAST
jgi:hypothetical protein